MVVVKQKQPTVEGERKGVVNIKRIVSARYLRNCKMKVNDLQV